MSKIYRVDPELITYGNWIKEDPRLITIGFNIDLFRSYPVEVQKELVEDFENHIKDIKESVLSGDWSFFEDEEEVA